MQTFTYLTKKKRTNNNNIYIYINISSIYKPLLEEKPTPEHLTTENPVFVTTFKSVQNEDGETVIETESKKITEEEGIVIEEVLSDTEPVIYDDQTALKNVEIVEVDGYTGELLYILLLNYIRTSIHIYKQFIQYTEKNCHMMIFFCCNIVDIFFI